MATEAQSLSREMAHAYLTGTNRPNAQQSYSTESENLRKITYEFMSEICITNPIPEMPKLMQTQYIQRIKKICCSIRTQKQSQNKPNSNPIVKRLKLMQSVYLQRIIKKNAAMGYEKQTQFKPNQSQLSLSSNVVVEWANLKKNECKLLCSRLLSEQNQHSQSGG